jgi:GDP-mannose pyrophosphatase NudK
MAKSARIVGETLLASGRFALTRTRIEVEESDGGRRILDHEIYRHKNAAAVLLLDPTRGLVRLVKQFRAGAYLADGALATIEVCAGMLDGDAPEICAIREAFEETGVRVAAAARAFDAYMSPGGSPETIACFVATYGQADCLGPGGGVDADERIEILEIAFEKALAMIETGEIRDAKTIALLYYARAKKSDLALG